MNATNPQRFDYLIKIVIIGDTNVGKTNIVSNLVEDKFRKDTKPTIGVEFGSKTFKFDNSNVKVQVWDTAGQERYHAITTSYYRGAAGVVLVYDVTNKISLENIQATWLRNLEVVLDKSIPKMLLGNKIDLQEERVVDEDSGKNMAMSENMAFFETSALSGENIKLAFETFIKKIYEAEKSKTFVKEKTKESLDAKGTSLKMKSPKKSSCC